MTEVPELQEGVKPQNGGCLPRAPRGVGRRREALYGPAWSPAPACGENVAPSGLEIPARGPVDPARNRKGR